MNIMLVSVTERIQEIGLRKALGAPPRVIRRQFLVESSVLGLAGGLLGVALGLIGAATLPSASQQAPQGGPHGPRGQGLGDQGTTPTQAQVSRELQRTYNAIISQGAVAGTNAEARSYVTQAQAAYQTAYTAYQAGDYPAARNNAALAQSLVRVADSLLHVADAGTSADAPVTVPAPNF
jgi:ABC-type antimicrobial peptide transport system permease subunit